MLVGVSLLKGECTDSIDRRPIHGCMTYAQYVQSLLWDHIAKGLIALTENRNRQVDEWLRNREKWSVDRPKTMKIIKPDRQKQQREQWKADTFAMHYSRPFKDSNNDR